MPRKQIVLGMAGLGMVVGLLALLADGAFAQAKGKTRPAMTKYLMRGIMKPNVDGLDALLKDPGPADDKAWDTVACHAACLSELSYALNDDGRGPDAAWTTADKALGDATAAILAAIEKKNFAAAKTGLQALKASCAGCHKVHRKR